MSEFIISDLHFHTVDAPSRMVEMQTLLIEFVENMEFSPVAATKDVIPGPLGTVTPM